MDTFEQIATPFFEGSVPLPQNVTVGAINKDGSFQYMKTFDGERTNEQSEPVYWIASMTKLITSIAVLQCVERGQIRLDDDVTEILPELKKKRIVVSYDGERNPEYRPASSPITMRQLLTHTSGLAYFNAKIFGLPKMKEIEGKPLLHGDVFDSFMTDLVREPGAKFEYSPGIDFAGKVVERVNPGHTLGSYLQQYLFDPLGIKDATFHLEQHEHLRSRIPTMFTRRTDGSLDRISIRRVISDPIPCDFGGGGLYTTCSELLKIYSAILREDERILSKESIRQMITPQLEGNGNGGVPKGLDKHYDANTYYQRAMLNTIPGGTPVNFGLGSLVPMVDIKGRRSKLSITWSGFSNCYWWIDMKKGVAGVYLSQLIPHGDEKTIDFMSEFESSVYQCLGKAE